MAVAGQVLLSSIAVLITIYADKYRRADFEKFLPDEPANLNLPIKETFDFIIGNNLLLVIWFRSMKIIVPSVSVGGGTAGCVLADRLSTKFSVLVIEAGGNPPPLQEIPNLVPFTQDLPEINFNFKSTAQKNAKLWNGGVSLNNTTRLKLWCSQDIRCTLGCAYVYGENARRYVLTQRNDLRARKSK